MYSLLSGLYQYYTRRPNFNFVILGLDNSGKTTLLEQIKRLFSRTDDLTNNNPSINTTPTVGLNIGRIEVNGVKCQFWDLGGAVDLHGLWENYYAEAHAVIFVVDATDIDRIGQVKKTLGKLVSNSKIEGVPMAILANKQDLPDQAMSLVDIKETFNPVVARMDALEARTFGVSAVTGAGVSEAIEWLLGRVDANSVNRPPFYL